MFAQYTEDEQKLIDERNDLEGKSNDGVECRRREIDAQLSILADKRFDDAEFPAPMLRMIRLALESTIKEWFRESAPFIFMNVTDDRKQGLFFYAVQRSNHDESLQICQDISSRGGSIDKVDVKGRTALFYAVKCNNVPCTKWLLDNGLDIDHVDRDGWTPLFEATRFGAYDAVEYLIQAGAVVSRKDHNLRTPIQISKRWNHPKVTSILAEARVREQIANANSPKVKIVRPPPAKPLPLPSSILGRIVAMAQVRPNIFLPLNAQTAKICREDGFWQGYMQERFLFVVDARWKKSWGTWKKATQAMFSRIRMGPQLLRSSQQVGSFPYGTGYGISEGEQEREIPVKDVPHDAYVPPFTPQFKRFDIGSSKDLSYTHGIPFSYLLQILEAAFIPADQEMWLAFLRPYRPDAPKSGGVDESRFYRYAGYLDSNWEQNLAHKCEFKGWANLEDSAMKRLHEICVDYDLGLRIAQTRFDFQALIEGLLWRSLAVCGRRLISQPFIDSLVEKTAFSFQNIGKDALVDTLPKKDESIEKGWFRLTLSDYGQPTQQARSCYSVVLPCGKGARVQTSSLCPGKFHAGYGPQPTLAAARIFLPYYAGDTSSGSQTPASSCVSYFHDFKFLNIKYPTWHEVPQATPKWLVEMHKPKLPTVKVNPNAGWVHAVSEESSQDSTPADLMVKIFDPAESQREINKLDFSEMSDSDDESYYDPGSEDEECAVALGLPAIPSAYTAHHVNDMLAQDNRDRFYR